MRHFALTQNMPLIVSGLQLYPTVLGKNRANCLRLFGGEMFPNIEPFAVLTTKEDFFKECWYIIIIIIIISLKKIIIQL